MQEFASLLCSWEPVQGEPVRNWVSPPVPLIPRVVDKLLMERCEFVLIVPQWRSRPWFQALEEFVFPRAQLFMLVPPGSVVDNNLAWNVSPARADIPRECKSRGR